MTVREAKGFAARMALFYGALFVVYGMHVPFMPLWLKWKGLSAGEISAIMAAPFFLRVAITPAVALFADRTGAHRAVMVRLAWAALILVLALSQAPPFWPLLAAAVSLIICNATLMPLAETMTVAGMREAGFDYGRVRLWGSLTFIAASFLGGLIIDRTGAGAGVWLVALGCVMTVMATHLLPRVRAEVATLGAATSPLWQAAEPRQLLSSKPFAIFLVAAGSVQAAHATFLTYGTLIWQGQGMSAGLCGALWAIAVLAEVFFFAYSGALMQRFGPANLLLAAAGLSVLRWAAMAFDPPLVLLVPLQMLHAITYGASHAAAIHFIHQTVPLNLQGSAQALYATMAAGLAMFISTLAAGWLYASAGSKAYLAMAVLAGLALAASFALRKLAAAPGVPLTREERAHVLDPG